MGTNGIPTTGQLGSPIDNEALVERTLTLAAEHAEHEVAAQQARLTSDNREEIITASQLEELVEARRRSAGYEYIRDRHRGQHNDTISLGLGVTALVKGFAAMQVEAQLATPDFTDLGEFEQVGDLPILGKTGTEPLVRLRLPDGMFVWRAEGPKLFGFFALADCVPEEVMPVEASEMAVVLSDVVRVVGDSGELWQNPNLRPDGTSLAMDEIYMGYKLDDPRF